MDNTRSVIFILLLMRGLGLGGYPVRSPYSYTMLHYTYSTFRDSLLCPTSLIKSDTRGCFLQSSTPSL